MVHYKNNYMWRHTFEYSANLRWDLLDHYKYYKPIHHFTPFHYYFPQKLCTIPLHLNFPIAREMSTLLRFQSHNFKQQSPLHPKLKVDCMNHDFGVPQKDLGIGANRLRFWHLCGNMWHFNSFILLEDILLEAY